MSNPKTDYGSNPNYNYDAVQREIVKDRRIKGREAKLIHALLRGRTAGDR